MLLLSLVGLSWFSGACAGGLEGREIELAHLKNTNHRKVMKITSSERVFGCLDVNADGFLTKQEFAEHNTKKVQTS